MRIPRIFSPEPLPFNQPEGHAEQSVTITSSSHINYICRVLRMKLGDNVYLFNNVPGQWLAEIAEISRHALVFVLKTFIADSNASNLRIEMGQCISRGERMDYAIQKAVEMGADTITPLFSTYCEVKLNEERQRKRLQHWQRLAISACEQCGRNRVPVINSPCHLEAWSLACNTELKLVLHTGATETFSQWARPSSVSILSGPEGGLSDDEVYKLEKQGFHSVTLGPRVLRTETAPVAALAIIQYLWGDWNQ